MPVSNWGQRKAKIFHRVVIACLLVHDVKGTTVVAIWTPDGTVTIAADSRQTDLKGNRLPDGCKIKIEGDATFSTAGLFEFRLIGFYMPDILHRIYVKHPTDSLSRIDVLWLSPEIADALFLARDAVEETMQKNPNLNIGEYILIRIDRSVLRALYRQVDIFNGLRHIAPSGVRSMSFGGEEAAIPVAGRSVEYVQQSSSRITIQRTFQALPGAVVDFE